MKIVDILIDAAQFLGLRNETEVLNNVTPETEDYVLENEEKVARLFNLVKFSIRELCSNYAPMVAVKKIQTNNKEFAISELENYIRIQNVLKDEQLEKYKIINRKIVFAEDGEYEVVYLTYPNITSMFEEVDFLNDLSPDVIVFGLCSYFSLAYGMFEEFENYHEEYVERAESLKGLKSFNLPNRRWEWEIKKLLK